MTGPIGWLTDLLEAEDYLTGIPGIGAWDVLSDDDKTGYLTKAYRRLLYDPNYNWPNTATDQMKNAQIELGLSYVVDPAAERRAELRESGVSSYSIGELSEDLIDPQGGDRSTFQSPIPQSGYPVAVLQLIYPYRRTWTNKASRTRSLDY